MKSCLVCGATYKPDKINGTRQKYCSQRCRIKATYRNDAKAHRARSRAAQRARMRIAALHHDEFMSLYAEEIKRAETEVQTGSFQKTLTFGVYEISDAEAS